MSKKTVSNSNPDPIQTQTSKREEILKKLSDIKKTVAVPVLNNHIEIPLDNILDVTVTTTNNNKLKMKITYTTDDAIYYVLLGMTLTKQVEECLKDPEAKRLVIDRYSENLKTEVKCE